MGHKPRGGGENRYTISPGFPPAGPGGGLCTALPVGLRVSRCYTPAQTLLSVAERAPRGRQQAPHRPAGPGHPALPGSRSPRFACRSSRLLRRGGRRSGSLRLVYCCRLAPSSVFLKAVTGRASFPLLFGKPQQL